MKLLYPTSLVLDVKKLEGFSVDLQPYNVKSAIPEEHIDAEVLVTWNNSQDCLKDATKRLTKLRWIQSLAAGPNDVLGAGFDADKITITAGSGLHNETVAEHALALLLNAARRSYEMRDYQMKRQWPDHLCLGKWPEGAFRSLRGANIVIWGFGNIGKTLASYLKPLGAKVKGIARSEGVRDGIEVFGEDKIPDLFPKTDALVMIVPGSKETEKALSAKRLKLLPKHAWVVNVGRGITVDEDALLSALEKGEIGGAALDVFVKEPLPDDSPLYEAPNLIFSPHAAGGRPQGAEKLIAENLRRFIAGQDMINTF